jgi:predicted TIM-barrel fold metal-dependent hydrolase
MSSSKTEVTTPKLTAPKGACDTHMHFYNSKYPTAPSALTTPPDAWVDDEGTRPRILVDNPAELYGFF